MLKKMNTLRKHLLVIIITVVPILTFAQSNFTASVADSTDIKGQFDYLYKKSTSYEQYKVIPISGYNTLKQNATDSIRLYKKEATNHLQEINSLNNKQETSNTEITQLNKELSTAQNTQNSVKLLGMEVGKKSYKLIMSGAIFCLTIISTILYLMYKRGHQVVTEARTRLKEVQEDLEKLRKSGILREQKLGHELISYKLRNKLV
jgi:preprotein translocase subunit SecF